MEAPVAADAAATIARVVFDIARAAEDGGRGESTDIRTCQ